MGVALLFATSGNVVLKKISRGAGSVMIIYSVKNWISLRELMVMLTEKTLSGLKSMALMHLLQVNGTGESSIEKETGYAVA